MGKVTTADMALIMVEKQTVDEKKGPHIKTIIVNKRAMDACGKN